MRLYCEFGNCPCRAYSGHGQCLHCSHGECWHKRSTQFDSPRMLARVPQYYKIPIIMIFTPILPAVPPLPIDYCPTVKGLPV